MRIHKSQNVDFAYDSSDLIIDHEGIRLEAFKSFLNDQIIIKEGNESKYGPLKWASLGYPILGFTKVGDYRGLFEFDDKGFTISDQIHIFIVKNKSEIWNLSQIKSNNEFSSW